MSSTHFTVDTIAPRFEGVAKLSSLGVIRLTGDDRLSFLHNQLSQKVNDLRDDARLGAWCTPQGRISALFRYADDGTSLYLVTPKDSLEAVAKRLKLFVLRAKVTIDTPDVTVYGVSREALSPFAEQGKRLVVEGGLLLNTGHGRDADRALLLDFTNARTFDTLQDEGQWFAENLRQGTSTIFLSARDEFVPQMIYLDKLGGVSFDKGCYPGQEVVARLKWVGKANRFMHLFVSMSPVGASAGDALYSDGNPVGHVVESVTDSTSALLTAVVHNKADVASLSLNAEGTQPLMALSSFTQFAD